MPDDSQPPAIDPLDPLDPAGQDSNPLNLAGDLPANAKGYTSPGAARPPASLSPAVATRWYADVTVYQWLVLLLASAGWVFDAFEGQIFNLTRVDMLHELLGPAATDAAVKAMGERLLAVFLLGGTLGGLAFGSLADRFGRKPILSATILCYSLFAGLTYFATSVWQVAALRFLVALGVGGEWAVAASLVAEVFPPRAGGAGVGHFSRHERSRHLVAAIAGLLVGANWRVAYLIGLVPAVLVVWVRSQVHEPKRWQEAEHAVLRRGRFRDLLGDRRWARRALLDCAGGRGIGHVLGRDRRWAGFDARIALCAMAWPRRKPRESRSSPTESWKRPAADWGCFASVRWPNGLGGAAAFALMHVLALLIVPLTCYWPQTYGQMLCIISGVRFLHAVDSRRLCDLFSRVVSRPSARDWRGLLLQRRPAAGGADLGALGMDQGIGHGFASRGDAVVAAIPGRAGSDLVSSGDKRPAIAGIIPHAGARHD